MRFRKRSAALVAAGIAGAMAFAACGSGSSGGSGDSTGGATGRAVFGEPTDWPENLMPLISAGNATSTADIEVGIFPEVYLIQPDQTLKYNSDLLTSEPSSQVSGDTQTVTYKLNPKANWSDGQPINADDFKYSYEIQKSTDPANGGCPALLSSTGYDQVQSVEGSDGGKTVTLTISPPYADWKSLFSGVSNFLFPAHVMDKGDPQANCDYLTTGWPIDQGFPNDISGGPWQLKKSNINNAQQVAVLTPNPNYFGEKPHLAQLVIQEIGNDPTTAIQGLKSGELNVIYPQPQLDVVDQVKALEPNIKSEINFGQSYEHLDFNASSGPLSDIKVRQAFGMALDRQTIVDQTVGQFSSDAQVLNNHIWLNTQPQYKDNAPDQYKKQNIAQAKALLESDGYTLGPDGVYQKNGERLSFKIDTTANNPLRQQTIQVMIPMLKEAGIQVEFNANPDIFAGPDKPTSLNAGGFQIALFAWVGSPFISTNPPVYESPANGLQQNYSRTGTAQIDSMLKSWLTETDDKKIADEGNEIDKLLWDQLATIPLYQKPTFIASSSNLRNVQDNPTQQGALWNANTWTVK